MPPSPFIDQPFSARLEAAEASHIARNARALADRCPHRPSALLEIAGGFATFFGLGSALSRAVGLGMSGPVTPADIDALEDFYRSRGERAVILVSPYSDPTLLELLGERGFRLAGLDTMLARSIDPTEPPQEPPAGITTRVAPKGEAAAWIRTSLDGFGVDGSYVDPEVLEALFQIESATYFFAAIDGEAVGSGAMDIHEGAAYFFAASTVPSRRGRGAQAALFRARLAHA